MLSFRKQILLKGSLLLTLFIALLFFFLDRSLSTFLAKAGAPGKEICFLVGNFKIAILILGAAFLFLYSLSTWILFNRLSRPLQKIANHILSYAEQDLPSSVLLNSVQEGEFGKIEAVLNAMTTKIEKQMHHLKLARRETEEILESLVEGVIALDSRGTATFANEAACKILGTSCNQLLTDRLNRVGALQNDLAEKCYEAVQDVLQTSEPVKRTWDDGKKGHTHLEVSAAPRPGQRGVILVLQDKSADFKILEIGKDFIANASHELRTPITIIRGFAETLQDYPNLSQQMLRDISEKIVRTSHRLEHLVKSLLTLADIENITTDKLQITDLVSIATHCQQFAITAHPTAQISFVNSETVAPILGDPQLLDLAIINLLENAIKYSPRPAQITLSLHKIDHRVELIVRDRGIGIPETDLPYIFDRFYTVDKARSRKSGGAGLGLSIVKTIVEKHMGTLLATSQLGVGSAFTLHFPLKERGDRPQA